MLIPYANPDSAPHWRPMLPHSRPYPNGFALTFHITTPKRGHRNRPRRLGAAQSVVAPRLLPCSLCSQLLEYRLASRTEYALRHGHVPPMYCLPDEDLLDARTACPMMDSHPFREGCRRQNVWCLRRLSLACPLVTVLWREAVLLGYSWIT